MSYVLIPNTVNVSKFSRGGRHHSKVRKITCTTGCWRRNRQWGRKKLVRQRNAYLFTSGLACTLDPCATRRHRHADTFRADGSSVINNVFPSWAIKYFPSGSLGWSGEPKGASTLVVRGRRRFGAPEFPIQRPECLTTHSTGLSWLAVIINTTIRCRINYLKAQCVRFRWKGSIGGI